MRQTIAFVILCTLVATIAVLVGTAEQPREDDLSRSIARLVETAR